MTSTNAFSTWELMHEFDTPIMSDEDLHTFGNVGEVMPESLTPLSVSILPSSFEKGIMKNFPSGTIKESKFHHQLFGIIHNRVAMSVFNLFCRTNKAEISIENRVHGLTVCGHEFITEEVHRVGVHRHGIATKLTELTFLLNAFKVAWKGKSLVNELGQFMSEFVGTYNEDRLDKFSSLLDIYDDISQEMEKTFAHMQCVHGKTSMLTTVYQIIVFSALSEGKNEVTPDFLSDVTLILSSCQNAESAEIPTALEEITQSIRQLDAAKIKEFCEIKANLGVEWLKQNCSNVHKMFTKFIEKNSHRGFQEVHLAFQ